MHKCKVCLQPTEAPPPNRFGPRVGFCPECLEQIDEEEKRAKLYEVDDTPYQP